MKQMYKLKLCSRICVAVSTILILQSEISRLEHEKLLCSNRNNELSVFNVSPGWVKFNALLSYYIWKSIV